MSNVAVSAHPRPVTKTAKQPTWLPAPRGELIALGIYFFLVVALTDIFNVRLGIELLILTVLIAAFVISRAGVQFLRDWWFFLMGMVMWNLSGPIARLSPFPVHLDFMLNTDRALFLGHVPPVLLAHAFAVPGQVTALDWIAAISYNMHLAEPFIASYFLWRLDRLLYLRFVSAALVLLVAGFLTFILFPAIPPWMASVKYHRIPDVINSFGLILRAHPLPFHGSPIFYLFQLRGDSVAAFPSEHAAFPLLEFLAFSALSRRLGALFFGWTVWVLFVIVYLGQHWVTDAIAGWLFALGAWYLVGTLLPKRGKTTTTPR